MSIWDEFSHKDGNIVNGDNGDIACDSYHKVQSDRLNMALFFWYLLKSGLSSVQCIVAYTGKVTLYNKPKNMAMFILSPCIYIWDTFQLQLFIPKNPFLRAIFKVIYIIYTYINFLYSQYMEDIQLMKNMGVTSYRSEGSTYKALVIRNEILFSFRKASQAVSAKSCNP